MFRVLVKDNSKTDAALLQRQLTEEGAQVEVCHNEEAAKQVIEANKDGFTAAFVLWDVTAPAFVETLALFRHRWPETPVVVMFEEFTAELGFRALRLGAKDVLQKPIQRERIKVCLQELLAAGDAKLAMLPLLRQRIHGESASLLAALRQLAKVIPYASRRVLLQGESGTGKELFAQAIHQLGPNADQPLIAVQISAINENVIESEMFGHERGAFTGAHKQHIGFFEQAGNGTLFLDEIGDLSQAAQIRLLRVIQEKEFRRLGGNQVIPFAARIVCATHRNLAEEARHNRYRADLFQRLNEVTIHVPPLRERRGDIEKLAEHFLALHCGEREVRFADETLKLMLGYPFSGNVRELENMIATALIACGGEVILPQHLPMKNMNDLLPDLPDSSATMSESRSSPISKMPSNLADELARLLSSDWLKQTYREASKPYIQAFDRVYLKNMLERHRNNITAAAKAADLDTKTFRKRWLEAGLPPFGGEEEEKADE
ncbi:MAG: sigma-54 dependent transcriptional regulator [Acidobacteriota bacterium]